MKLKIIFARFYKSFNFDHLRKVHPSAQPKPWESYEGSWYPYVEIPIDPEITTVVGANESGKSHLLSAIRKAITGAGFKQRDLCRYSPFFNVQRGRECWPHLGVAWTDVTTEEVEKLRAKLTGGPTTFDHFLMFREGPETLIIYLPDGKGGFYSEILKDKDALTFGEDVLPKPFEIKPDIALPNFIPLTWLLNPTSTNGALISRSARSNLLSSIDAVAKQWAPNPTVFQQNAPNFFNSLNPFFGTHGALAKDASISEESLGLARDLLIELADVEPARLRDLSDAISDGEDGHANALVSRINDQLAKKLNFPKWWVQDRDFSLRVTPREMDLVFTIQDRTATEYTFSERSSGLKYFLSYLIQSQSRKRSKIRSEILLMDEPDTYLSAEAQQDLLKIFNDFAFPEADVAPIQVVFVTHSPFLIDKNHADRIRVLEKGKGLDGTRVIRNASQNHYEPLRSAFGAFVGEAAFIGACNLLVEGASDQILLSGAARLTRQLHQIPESETLDLNRMVLVPCGSASQIPYMLYLIRGRDADKPPVIALLDSDTSGNEAAKLMRKENRAMRRLIDKDYVIQLGNIGLFEGNAPNTIGIEDLIPPALAVSSANLFLDEIGKFRDIEPVRLSIEDVNMYIKNDVGIFAAINKAAEARDAHIEKVGFARAVVEQCKTSSTDEQLTSAIELFLSRMRKLFREINTQRRRAERENVRERVGSRVDRQQAIFLRDHPVTSTKEQALICLENIESILDDSLEADAVKTKLNGLKRSFSLEDGLADPVPDYLKFSDNLRSLKDEFAISRLQDL
jgi:predicted ATPase